MYRAGCSRLSDSADACGATAAGAAEAVSRTIRESFAECSASISGANCFQVESAPSINPVR
jgi:L-lactate utilization protein LutB